ncbi:MAG: ATP-binding cassette domain-containing protein [bacterium]|nr:ATP-binding cassette domain-containing protein [bacterium]
MTTNAIELDAVTKSFGRVRAVDGLSAVVPAGSIHGFLGPNGAGKTTTLRLIMNIFCPDAGRIAVLGRPMGEAAKRRIGYLPEERGLYRKMTVRGTLAFLGGLQGMRGAGLAREIARWLGEVGLDGWADRRVEELSKGMQQKLQFVAAILHDPELLILDEPFSGLDPLNLDLLKGIMLAMRERGKTVLFSTHMMEQAERLCDSILLVDHGRAVLDGPLDRILASHRSNVVSARLEGDTAFVDGLAMVRGVRTVERRLEITLADGADSQELLAALVGRVAVRAFEEKAPTLHEIFVQQVGTAHE